MQKNKNGLIELIFDLACAFALMRTTVLLAEPSDGYIAVSSLGLFLLMAVIILAVWASRAVFVSRNDSGSIWDTILLLAQVPCILIGAESIRDSSSSTFILFITSFGAAIVLILVQYGIASARRKGAAPEDIRFSQLRSRAASFTVLTGGVLLLDYAAAFEPAYLSAPAVFAYIILVSMLVFYLTQMEKLATVRHPESGSRMLLFTHFLIPLAMAVTSVPVVLSEGSLESRYMVNFLYAGLALFVIGTILNRRYAEGERVLPPYVMGSFGGFLILGYLISQLFRENKTAVLLITMIITALLATEIVSYRMIADIHEERKQENREPDLRM